MDDDTERKAMAVEEALVGTTIHIPKTHTDEDRLWRKTLCTAWGVRYRSSVVSSYHANCEQCIHQWARIKGATGL